MIAPTSFFADYGCHVRILEEARVLTALGREVTIVAYHNGRTPDGVTVRRTWPIPWRSHHEVGSSRHKLAFDVLLAGSVLAEALRRRPDVVHGHLHEGALLGGVVAKSLGVPLVFDYQGSLSGEMVDHGFLDPGGKFFGPVRRIEARINRLPDVILTSSHHAEAQLTGDFGVGPERVMPLPDCVNADVFRPDLMSPDARAAALANLGVPAGRRIVAYLGLLARHQGTHLLLEAARRVVEARPDTHFLIMGFPGTDVFHAQAMALGLGDHVTFTGRVPYQDAPAHLALGDVAVAPKISTSEGSGKLLNYMAMGLATVTFDTPVSREYLREDGCYAPAGNAAAFADALIGLLDKPAEAAGIGRRLRDRAVREYSWRRAGETLVELYDQLANRPRRGEADLSPSDVPSLSRSFPT